MKRAVIAWCTILVLFGSFNCRADGFVLDVDSPSLRISLPSVPAIKMAVHARHAAEPQFRFEGSQNPYAVSVFTPVAAAGMTPLECAAAIVRTLPARPGGPEAGQIYKARVDESTFVAIYVTQMPVGVRLNAHVMSAAGGTRCVEVHAAKLSVSDDELAPWIDGFEKARIRPGG